MKKPVLILLITIFCMPLNAHSQENTGIEEYLGSLEKALMIDKSAFKEIWEGFDLNNFPIALYNERNAFLINHPSPEAPFAPTDRRINGLSVSFSKERIREFSANTSMKYNEILTSIFNVKEGMTPGSFYDLLFHEVFHSFAGSLRSLKGRYGNALLTPFFPSDDPVYYAYAHIEQQLLKEAVFSDDDFDAAERIKEFYYMLFRRNNMAGEEYSEFEYNEQINEGIATYAGYRGLELMGYENEASEKLAEQLDMRIDRPDGFRKRCYGTGAALARLLDRFYPGWKNDFDRNVNLVDMLRLEIPPTDKIDEQKLLADHKYDALRALFHRSLFKYKQDLRTIRKGIMNFDRIEVVFPENTQMTLNFDPMNITAVSDTLLYHSRFLRLLLEDNFEIEMNGVPCLTKIYPRNMFLVRSLNVGKPEMLEITVDGENLTGSGELSFNALTLKGENLYWRIYNGSIRQEYGNIIIRLNHKKPEDRP
ncbi:hypothetical protein ACFL6G_00145 [candidate division KSB1 bacterium]